MTQTAGMTMTVRRATVRDVPYIAEIVNFHAHKGAMLPRAISRIYDNVRDYYVVEHGGEVVACGSLHVTWADLAEIRSLAVREEFMGRGYGRMLIDRLVEEARELEIDRVFVLTYQRAFFAKHGFAEIDKAELPHKIWSDCVNCVHFPNCNEVAMIRSLAAAGEETP